MCGILGVIRRDPDALIDPDKLAAARDTLSHRGPDEEGLWHKPGVGLAHRRLSIIDLAHGQQPMLTDDQRFALTYNGELYNHAELQTQLAEEGIPFHTRCDTEVVLKAIAANGPDALSQFNGMFAFGHWDQQARKLLLVRDRLGQKPLYWYRDADQLVFASELKAILHYLGRRFELDPAAIDQFLTRGYILSPRTIFKGIHKLPAGCLLQLDAGEGRWDVSEQIWWDVEQQDAPCTEAEALDELDGLLHDAISKRLISDVPIGCLLSGGIDSSLITAIAAKVSGDPVKAFSIGFDESEQLNELPYAEVVAKAVGCDWQSRQTRSDDFAAQLTETTRYFDEPYGNFTMFSMRKLSQLCREQMTVVLSGQGGDELTGGYPGRYNWVMDTAAQAAPGQGRAEYAPMVDDLVGHLRHSSFLLWPTALTQIVSDGLRAAAMAGGTPATAFEPFWRKQHRSRLGQVLYTDVKTNLPDYLVCLEERMSMSASLESRNPLLDHRVVSFLLSLPDDMKIRNGENKWILKQLAYRYVPREAIDRPKRGFTPPLNLWIDANANVLADLFRQTETSLKSLFNPDWMAYLQGGKYQPNATAAVFYSVMLAKWFEHYGEYVEPFGQGLPSLAQPRAEQRVLREQDPASLAESRWFCQAMANFKNGEKLQILGDDAPWHARLATDCGVAVTDDPAGADATVLVGPDAAEQLAGRSLPLSGSVLLFIPFRPADRERLQRLAGTLANVIDLQGQQAVPTGEGQGVLIAKGTVKAAAPTTSLNPPSFESFT